MNQKKIIELRNVYRSALLDDVVPFWQKHSPDPECGGYFTLLDRTGRRYGDDKPVWLQGREAWLFATLYHEVERRPEWLALAEDGCRFLDRHCFDASGKMYFCVTRDGRPLRMRRYAFSEVFGCIAFAALGQATGRLAARQRATQMYDSFVRRLRTPGLAEPKTNPTTRPMKGLSPLMCLLNMADTMIRTGCVADSATRDGGLKPSLHAASRFEADIDAAVAEVLGDFVKPERRVVLETVAQDGSIVPGPDGRVMNPGHAIECAWFVLDVARRRGDGALAARSLSIIDFALERGWDDQHGGLLYFVDVDGLPPTQLEHDMKLWWPHNEALIALLMAWQHTRDAHYAAWFEKMHAWTFSHFPDPQHGEWFGYLHRDGTVSTPLKGGIWKGAFHVPRCLLYCTKILDAL